MVQVGGVEFLQPPAIHVPVDWIIDEGSAIEADQKLLKVSERILQAWIDDRVLNLRAKELDLAEVELDVQSRARNLERRIDDRRLNKEVAEARIKRSRQRDGERLEILQTRYQQAKRELEQAQQRAEQLRQLAAQGHLPPQELTNAEQQVIRQQQYLRTSTEELEVLQATTNSVSRTRAQFDLARTTIDLGNNDDGALFVRQQALELERWQKTQRQRVAPLIGRDVKDNVINNP